MTTRTTTEADRGSASIWVLACSALLLAVALTLSVRATAALARHRAEFAADSAALAAAAQIGRTPAPCAAAGSIALANGAQVRSCELSSADNGRSGQISVTVSADVKLLILGAGTVSASARAERDPP